jgi:hypothetical protein
MIEHPMPNTKLAARARTDRGSGLRALRGRICTGLGCAGELGLPPRSGRRRGPSGGLIVGTERRQRGIRGGNFVRSWRRLYGPSLRNCRHGGVTAAMNATGATVFSPVHITEEDWKIILNGLATDPPEST